MKTNDHIKTESRETRTSIISQREDGIVQMNLQPVDEIEVEDAKNTALAVKHFMKDKKVALLAIIDHYVSMDKDVREFWASDIPENLIKCEAFVIENVSMKMIAKFYILFNKPKRPTQIFSSEEKAVAWLNEFKD